MNDDIERLNDRNRELNQPSEGNFSKAKDSSITHPEEDNKKMAQGIIMELGNHREELDSIKESIKLMGDQMNALTEAISQMVQGTMQPQGVPGATPQMNMEMLGNLGDLLEKGVQAYKSLKGNPPSTPALIDQDFINKRMVESFMEDLDTGKSISNFIKTSLKKISPIPNLF